MIVTTARDFLEDFGDGSRFPLDRPPCLRAAMIVTPRGLALCEESAGDNRYMAAGGSIDIERAHAQHRALAAELVDLGMPVFVFPGQEGQPDGVFPNNVFATVPRRLIIGSMRHEVRRREAEREDVPRLFRDTFGYEIHDLSTVDCVAELTGPLVIDRARRIGFCGLSGRADEAGCKAMHGAFDLRLTYRFHLASGEYHTNIALAILAGRFCVVHPGSFADEEVPRAIAAAYPERTLILTDEEKEAFAGNCIAVTEEDVLFSETSLKSLRPSSVDTLELDGGFRVHGVAVDEIEKAGGSLRCMIAEVF